MLSMSSTLTLTTLHRVTRELKDDLQKACDKTALDIEADAKGRVPVDTGFLRRSIHSVTSQGSDYAGEGDPPVQRPPGISAAVGVAAPYGLYVELGTHKMAGRPYLTPAVERHRQAFQDTVRDLVKD